ncbi:MAG: hypothetical protein O2895_07065 [Chloroflexi bacterium]|nr:hypothetical protein [Chloroflexota bacterium]
MHETRRVLEDVARERRRQHGIWGEQALEDATGTPDDREHLGRVRERVEARARDGSIAWRDILIEEVAEAFAESDPAKMRAELVQVAAVAVQWVEAIDRRGGG